MDQMNIMESQIEIKSNKDALSMTGLGQNLKITHLNNDKPNDGRHKQKNNSP
jgi:hypothetical protein